MTEAIMKKGLEGVIADESEVSKVMPESNSLTYKGYRVQDLCKQCSFEEVAYLLWNGELPNEAQLKEFEKQKTLKHRKNIFAKIEFGKKRYWEADVGKNLFGQNQF